MYEHSAFGVISPSCSSISTFVCGGVRTDLCVLPESYVIQLALYLDLLLRHCKPATEQLFKLADRVIENVKSKDPEYHRHLQEICRSRPKVVVQVSGRAVAPLDGQQR